MGEVDPLFSNCILQHLHGFTESARLCLISWREKKPFEWTETAAVTQKISAKEEYLSSCFSCVIHVD